MYYISLYIRIMKILKYLQSVVHRFLWALADSESIILPTRTKPCQIPKRVGRYFSAEVNRSSRNWSHWLPGFCMFRTNEFSLDCSILLYPALPIPRRTCRFVQTTSSGRVFESSSK